jgi:glycerate 2-kinase
MRTQSQLIEDAQAIWQAGVAAVDSRTLVRDTISFQEARVQVGDYEIPWPQTGRIIVVGAGKAGAGMAQGLLDAIPKSRLDKVEGWVNVPDDCVRETPPIHLHGARPPGLNEPTERGQHGAEQMVSLVRDAGPNDIVFCLISGGGSALTPAPAAGLTIAEKQRLTQTLSAAGADIEQLNTVRKHLSLIKGGRLAAACGGPVMISLIISDVLGDPLDVIASGMTIPDSSTADDALNVMRHFSLDTDPRLAASMAILQNAPNASPTIRTQSIPIVIGNNAIAVDAAGMEAERRGYSHAMSCATKSEGHAEDVGRHLAHMAERMRDSPGPDCLISGGEPIVALAPENIRGKGGRNQQLCLAALGELGLEGLEGICILSGGTDGEDGPTDAAGARIDATIANEAARRGLDGSQFLARNDAYHFFDAVDGLIRTGPTHTNVCDLRVVVVSRIECGS